MQNPISPTVHKKTLVDLALSNVADCVSQPTTTPADVEHYRCAFNALLDVKLLELAGANFDQGGAE